MQRFTFCLAGLVASIATDRLAAQPLAPTLVIGYFVFTDVYVTNTSFHFKTDHDEGVWQLEYKTSLDDPWWLSFPFPVMDEITFDMSLTGPTLFLRARFTGSTKDWEPRPMYSANMAYYIQYPLTNGFLLLANPFDNGRSNRLSEIMPAPPGGTRAHKYNAGQGWAAVSQFVWDAWTPDLDWRPGEGLAFVVPKPFLHTIAGATATLLEPPIIRAGANLLGMAVPGGIIFDPSRWFTDPPFPYTHFEDGDLVLLYDSVRRQYEDPSYYIEGVGWLPDTPSPQLGEGFWFVRQPMPSWTTSIYFNNWVPEAGIDAPLSYAGRLIEGTNWLAQLYYSLFGPPDTPIGAPVPFRSGAAAGYVDTSGGGVVTLPHPTGIPVNVQIRYWQTNGPGSGQTEPITVQCGTGPDIVPPLPANLLGLGGSAAMQQAHLTRPRVDARRIPVPLHRAIGKQLRD